MLATPQLDPLGGILVELRDDAYVANLVAGRVRGFEPKPETRDAAGNLTSEGDALGPGHYKAFVVISALDVPPHRSVPITFATYGLRSYGTTPQNAWAVWGAVVRALHMAGPRVKTSGLGIYQTLVVSGGQQDEDPRTQQPLVHGTIQLVATTQAVA